MKKKLLSVLTALLTAIALCIGMVACSNGTVDTFNGALSKESYESSDDAVAGFLATEISGAAVNAELVDYKKTGDLTQQQIDELEVGEVLEEGDTIVSAEIVDVTYKRSTRTGYASAPSSAEQNTAVFTIYIIIITPNGTTVKEYRYYVPKANNGDVLTRSYFEDVLNPEKYVNCTQEYSSTSNTKIGNTSSETKINYTIKTADNRASLEMTMPNLSNLGMTNTTIYGYFEEVDDVFSAWMSQDGTNYTNAEYTFLSYGIKDMTSFVSMCLPQFDHSYYEKTSYGFKIQDEFLSEYVAKALNEALGATDVKAELEIKVREGRISKMTSKITATIEAVVLKMNITAKEEVEFSKFGSTSVNRPVSIA